MAKLSQHRAAERIGCADSTLRSYVKRGMSTRKKALFSEVATTTARLAASRQSLEDARNLSLAGFASDVVFALHVEAGAFNAWLKASEAFQACRD
jgi:hypothetical protein